MKNIPKCLVSVIVPIYNIEEYVGKCIESIVTQSYKNLEIILVDDGSKDNSGKICDQFAKEDSRIQVIHKENGGLVSARKAGLAIAEGEYIGFVDGDDYVEPLFFETLLNLIYQSESDFVHTGYIWEKNGKKAEILPVEEAIYDLHNKKLELIEKNVLDKFDISPSIWSKLFKCDFIKECYESVPDSQSQGEDLICLCICLLKGTKAALYRNALYHYNVRRGSLTNYINTSNVVAVTGCYNTLKMIFEEFDVYEVLKQSLEKHFLRRLMCVMKNIPSIAHSISLYSFNGIEELLGKRIVIYGAGNVGQDYYTQISKCEKCNIVGWLDGNYNQCNFNYREVQGMDALDRLQYDVILIAVKRISMAMQIKSELINKGIEEDKIIWKEPREAI